LRLNISDWKPETIQSVMKDLTFVPRVIFDTGTPPPPICCYQAEDGALTLPRCYGGLGTITSVKDSLAEGEEISLDSRASLNPLQQQAFEASCSALRKSPHACVLTLPCGFGKTVVSLVIAASLGRKTLVVVHKENLLVQWLERVKTFLPNARTGVIQQGKAEFRDVDVCLAMLQTICCRQMPEGCLESFGTIVLDEAHHLAAPYFSQLFFKLPCRYILGLTATPKRKDGCSEILHLFMGPFSFQLSSRTDADVKVFVSSWRNKFTCNHDPTPPEVQRYKTRLTVDKGRNAHILELCSAAANAGRNIICLSDRVEHLVGLKEEWRLAARHPEVSCALFIGGRGKVNSQERKFAEDSARVIFATFAMAAEGLDIPRLDTLILATPVGDVTQAVGRILRPCAEKKSPVVVDICDDGCKAFGRLAVIRRGCFERSAFQVFQDVIPCFE